MSYVIFEDVASGNLYEGMVYGPRRQTALEKAKTECKKSYLANEIRLSQVKQGLRQLRTAEFTTGLISVATFINNFTEKTALSHGFEDVMEYVESPESLAGAAVAFGLMGVAYLFKKAADFKKAEKLELQENLYDLDEQYEFLDQQTEFSFRQMQRGYQPEFSFEP